MNKFCFSVLLFTELSVCSSIHADVKNDSINHQIDLKDIVITANQKPTSRTEAPAIINILTKKSFSISQSQSLADGLSYIPGVRVEDNCESCGFKQARINGLDGHYSQILIDSKPVFSALSSIYGLELVPENLLERVEIMRGGGSALYGSSSIGGTINLITRLPQSNSAEIKHSIMSIGGTNAFDNNMEINASVVTPPHNAGIYIYQQIRQRDEYDANNDNISELPRLTTETAGFKSFANIGKRQHITIDGLHTESTHRGGTDFNLAPDQATLAEQAKHNITEASADYSYFSANSRHHFDIYTSVMNTLRDSYSGGTEVSENPNLYYTQTKDILSSNGIQYRYTAKHLIFAPSDVIVKMEYSYDHLSDKFLGFNYIEKQTIHTIGALVQNEWKTKDWSILVGGRIDKHNLIDHPIISPRLNLRYHPCELVNLRASYGAGFRAPQTFDEDLHVDMAGGERFRVKNENNLKEERSHSFSLSNELTRQFSSVRTSLTTECFYTQLNNAFTIRTTNQTDANGCSIRLRYNGSNAFVYGINIEGKVSYNCIADLDAGFTLQKSRYTEAQKWSDNENVKAESKMFRSPDAYGFLTLSVHPINSLTISTTGTYTGSMLVAHAESSGTSQDLAVNTPSFFDTNIRLAYTFNILSNVRSEAVVGIQNIFNSYQNDFDKGYERDSDYIYGPSLPRSFFASLGFTF